MQILKVIKISLLFIIGFSIGTGLAYSYPYYQFWQSQRHFQQTDHRSANTIGGITTQQKPHYHNWTTIRSNIPSFT